MVVCFFGINPHENYPLKKSKMCAGMRGASEAVTQYPGAPQAASANGSRENNRPALFVICEVQL